MFLINPFVFNAGTSLINELSNLALLTNLKVCLDAGDPNSYPGSGQTWFDLSGNGNHFYRGTGSGSDGADPTYTPAGNGGTYREYFSFDGADFFTLGQANPTWVNNLHKNNAKFSLVGWFYSPNTATGTSEVVFGTADQSQNFVGVLITIGGITDGDWGIAQNNGGGGTSYGRVFTTSARLNSGAWNFLALSIDEAASTCLLQVNAAQETPTFSYTSPSSAGATYTARIGDGGNGARSFKSGDRLAALAMWEGVTVSAANFSSLYTATKSRFGV